MRLLFPNVSGSIGVFLVATALIVSCRPDDPDVEPLVPEGAVDMGIVMTR